MWCVDLWWYERKNIYRCRGVRRLKKKVCFEGKEKNGGRKNFMGVVV